jgi:hypothetical protein
LSRQTSNPNFQKKNTSKTISHFFSRNNEKYLPENTFDKNLKKNKEGKKRNKEKIIKKEENKTIKSSANILKV